MAEREMMGEQVFAVRSVIKTLLDGQNITRDALRRGLRADRDGAQVVAALNHPPLALL